MPAVSPSFADSLAEVGTRRRLRRGERLVHEGGRSGAVLFVVRGTVRVLATTYEGDEIILAIRGPGDLIGDLGPLGGVTATASVVAREDGEVVVIPASRFVELVRGDPELTSEVLHRLVTILGESQRRSIHWLTRPLTVRVAAELLALCDGEDAPPVLHVSQLELAGLCGASRSSVSEVLGDLRARRMLSTGRGRLLIHDVAALRALLAEDGTADREEGSARRAG